MVAPSTRTIALKHAHPLDPLTRPEILTTVAAIRSHIKQGAESVKPIEKILFNSIGLAEPDKYAVLKWAGTFTDKEIAAAGGVAGDLTRQAEVSTHEVKLTTGTFD
jgi:Cu2+-containing amine oxidase